MDNVKDDKYYVSKIIEEINTIQKYLENVNTYEQFEDNQVLIDAVLFRLVQMVESIKKLSTEFKGKYKDIQWNQIVGFRNGIVHDYGRTDYTIVYDIITKDIVDLKATLEK